MSAFVLALLSAAVWGCSAFLEKLGLSGGAPLSGVLARSVGVCLGGAVFALAAPGALRDLPRMGWRSAAFLAAGGALASIVGQIFFYQALKKGEIGRVASVGGAWPVFAFLLSMLFLGEPADGKKILGVLLVVAGVALLR